MKGSLKMLVTRHSDFSWLIDIVNKLKRNTVLNNTPIHIYVRDDAYPNAWVYPTFHHCKTLTVTSSLLFNMSKSDVTAVLSHELGHLIDFKLHPQLISLSNRKSHNQLMMTQILRNSGLLCKNFWNHCGNLIRTLLVFSSIAVLYFAGLSRSFISPVLNSALNGIGIILATVLIIYLLISLNYDCFERHLEHHADLNGSHLTSKQSVINSLLDMQCVTNDIGKNIYGKQFVNTEDTFSQKCGLSDHPTINHRIQYLKKYS